MATVLCSTRVLCDPFKLSVGELERLTRRYTAGIVATLGPDSDVPAPDVNTNERVMAWVMDTYSMRMGHTVTAVVTGKPVEMGGSLGRREATGRGCMIVTREALRKLGMPVPGTRVVVQGFGNVGSIAAELMEEQGMTVVEVLIAAFLLIIASLAALQIVDSGRRNTARAEGSQVRYDHAL